MATKKAAAKKAVATEPKPAAKTAAKKIAANKVPAVKAEAAAPEATKQKKAPTHDEIAQLAHKYWEERGGHHGSHHDDWLRAAKELGAE